jgi:A/G-specific adenine glycosylase
MHAEALLPATDIEPYTQGMMDLGATICVRSAPKCLLCPVGEDCVARSEGRVDALPAARPPREVPRREVQLLVCVRGDEVLLERRPATGIWSGLWSLPEVAVGADAVAVALARAGGTVKAHAPLPPVQHAFTHFTLTMHPQRVEVRGRVRRQREDQQWLPRERALTLGLPAPIRRLLETLAT